MPEVGDRHAATIDVDPAAATRARVTLGDHPTVAGRVDRVIDLVAGYESPYGLELLAAVHWAVSQDGPDVANDPASVGARIRSQTRRAQRMFTVDHIDAAWARLDERGWLSSAVPG